MLKDRDAKQSIQVTIRVRPLLDKQLADDPHICVTCEQANSLQLHGAGDVRKFTFDSICFNESQEEIFARVGRKCTLDCLQGYNCTIFAYGQTGAGKTYTMMGLNFQHENYYQQRGLIPRTMQFLFECIDKEREAGVNFIIRCTFLEIYNEQIIDLLNKSNANMQLREDTRKGVYVQGLTEEMISKSDEAMEILYKGSKSRHVGSTFYNETSSRSHSVFTLQIESRYAKNGVVNTKSRQFNFIDLAGSERTKQSTGERLKEGCNINKSLMNLAAVINALSEVSEGKPQHVNYRNSKLTFLLKDSLGGNSKTNLIANISPAFLYVQQTLSTLGFARRAKLIKRQKACINEDTSGNLDSMKNQIKRLKQQIITLMSRQQGQSINQLPNQEQSNKMTTIMHEYVSQQIDKQTKLEVEIRKLNDRIIQLQTGVKQYSNNEIHLRMIIAVYEDKITRLKEIERILAEKVGLLNQEDEQSKMVIEYFKNERLNLIKEIDALKKQTEGSRFLKELLKEAKIIKDQGQVETLKDLLAKNNSFLTTIHSRLYQIQPQKAQFENGTEFQKKIGAMEKEFAKKEEENTERMEQLHLELAEFKTRNDQTERLLEDAVGVQISLEEKAKASQEENLKLTNHINNINEQVKSMQAEIVSTQAKSQEQAAELKADLLNSQSEITLLKKELSTLQNHLNTSAASETTLKKEVQSLQDDKFKIEKTILQNMEELREHKNKNIKLESEISILQKRLETMGKENEKQKEQQTRISEQLAQEKKNHRVRTDELLQRQRASVQMHLDKQNTLATQIEQKDAKIINLLAQLSKSTQSFENVHRQFTDKEEQLKGQIKSKEEKISQLIALVNEKEVSDNDAYNELNKTKIQLVNAYSENDARENKLKKVIEDLKEKVHKEKSSYELLEVQVNQRAKQYDKLNQQYKSKKKQCSEMNEANTKLSTKIQNLQEELEGMNQKVQSSSVQLYALRQSEKQCKLAVLQAKNQVTSINKNIEMQVDSLRHQICLRDQQIQQLGKELSKNKDKFERQIAQLDSQRVKDKEMFESHEQLIKHNMENHLAVKEKKIAELKTAIQEVENRLKTISTDKTEMSLNNEQLHSKNIALESDIASKTKTIINLQHQLEQQIAEFLQLKQSHGKEIEEILITHGEQIDHKNEQIEAYMSQNQSVIRQLEQFRLEQANQLEQLKQQQVTQIQQLKQEQNTEIAELKQQQIIQAEEMQERYTNEVKQLKQQQFIQAEQFKQKYNNQLAKLAKAQTIEAEKFKQQHIVQVEQVKQQKNMEVEQTKQMYTNQLEQLQQKITQLQQQITQQQEQITQQKQQVTQQQQQVTQLQQTKQDQINQIEQLKQQQVTQVEELKLRHAYEVEQLKQLKKEQETQVEEMKRRQTNELEQLKGEQINLLKKQKDLQEQISISQQRQSDLYIQNNDLIVRLEAANNDFQLYRQAKEQQVQNIYKNEGHNLQQVVMANNAFSQKINQITTNYQSLQTNYTANTQLLQVLKKTLLAKEQQISTAKETTNNYQKSIQLLSNQVTQLQNHVKQTSAYITILQDKNQNITIQSQSRMTNLITENQTLSSNLQRMQKLDIQNKARLSELNTYIYELTKILQNEKCTVQNLTLANKSLEERIKSSQERLKSTEEERKKTGGELNKVREEMNVRCTGYDDEVSTLSEQCRQLSKENVSMKEFINTKVKELSETDQKWREQKENKLKIHNSHQQVVGELEKMSVYKQKWQFQTAQIEKMKNQMQAEERTNLKMRQQLSEGKESENNLKMIIDNTESQIRQLEIQLQEKDAIYKKLLQKIAKNENESKKTTNSEHYLKTIELLEKSRAEQLELRRQNEELRKNMSQLKQNLDEKDRYVRQVEKKSQTYCISMHKRLEQIQTDYVELQKNQEKLLKDKKSLEKQIHEGQMLKISIGKLNQKNEELESRLKKSNLDYIQLETEFTEMKKSQLMANSNEDKTGYINRLKAEVAALKTQKVLLTDTLSKEREEKTKLKADMRYGKDGNDISMKVELQKKINENKNLQQLIFEIINQLKICVVEPKTKLEAIRSVIMGTIKEKNNEVKYLKEKVKEYETELQQRGSKVEPPRDTRQLKTLSISNARNAPHFEESHRFEKQKDASYLNNNSRQKMKEFQNYYAKFRQGEETKNR